MIRAGHPRPAALPVLLYHRIAADPGDRFAVAPGSFAEHVEVMLASGRTPLTLGHFARCLRGEARMPARPLVVTFDDGYAETPEVLAGLAARGLPATLYVTTGAIDAPGGLAGAGLLALAATEGVELGAHTVSHPYLDAVHAGRAREEIASSRQALAGLIDRPVDTFAYPHGAYDHRVREAVIAAGYTSAAAVKNALSHAADDPFAVARYTCTATTSAAALERVLEGHGAPLAWRAERLRTRAARARRQLAHRVRLEPSPV